MGEWKFFGSSTKSWTLSPFLQIFKLVATLMVWGMFFSHALGPLICVHRCLTKDIVSKHLCWPSIVLRWWFIPIAMATFNKIMRPAIVLVLNRIDLRNMKESLFYLGGLHNLQIWIRRSICGVKLKYLDPQLSNLTLLENASESSSMIVDFTSDLYQYLVESMQRRINAVLKPTGCQTKCWWGSYKKVAWSLSLYKLWN